MLQAKWIKVHIKLHCILYYEGEYQIQQNYSACNMSILQYLFSNIIWRDNPNVTDKHAICRDNKMYETNSAHVFEQRF